MTEENSVSIEMEKFQTHAAVLHLGLQCKFQITLVLKTGVRSYRNICTPLCNPSLCSLCSGELGELGEEKEKD